MRNWLAATKSPIRPTVGLLCCLALSLSACSGGTASGEQESEGAATSSDGENAGDQGGGEDGQASNTLTISLGHIGGENLDPRLGAARSKTYLTSIFDHLVGCNADGKPDTSNGIAEEWSTSDDGTMWTFTLREGLTFHNGEELTADDAKFSLEYFMAEESITANAGLLRETIESIEAPSPTELVVTTTAPYGFLDYDLSCIYGVEGMVLPKDYIEENGPDVFAEQPVGSGPYEVEEQSVGSFLKLRKAESYWFGEPSFETILFQLTPDPDTRISQLQTGEADVIDVSREQAPDLEGEFGIYTRPGAETVFGWLNNTWEGVLANQDIREAMSISVDREAIVESLFKGQADAAGEVLYGSYAVGYQELPPVDYNVERATELVANSGVQDPSITLYSFERPGVPEVAQLAEILAASWQQIGLSVEIVPTEYGSYRGLVQQGETINSASIMSISNAPTWLNIYQLFGADGLLSTFQHDEFTSLVSDLAAQVEQDEFGAAQLAVAEHLRDGYWSVPLIEAGSVYAADPEKVGDWELGIRSFDMGVEGIYFQ